MVDIKRAVKSESVEFAYYRDGSLWYETLSGELFPVPVEDIGTATFSRYEKPIMLMRYMRKWNEKLGVADTEK